MAPHRGWPEARVARSAALLAVLGLLLACDPGDFRSGAPAPCTEAGAQCQLAEGPLGVCERSTCAPGRDGPCFQCTPQH